MITSVTLCSSRPDYPDFENRILHAIQPLFALCCTGTDDSSTHTAWQTQVNLQICQAAIKSSDAAVSRMCLFWCAVITSFHDRDQLGRAEGWMWTETMPRWYIMTHHLSSHIIPVFSVGRSAALHLRNPVFLWTRRAQSERASWNPADASLPLRNGSSSSLFSPLRSLCVLLDYCAAEDLLHTHEIYRDSRNDGSGREWGGDGKREQEWEKNILTNRPTRYRLTVYLRNVSQLVSAAPDHIHPAEASGPSHGLHGSVFCSTFLKTNFYYALKQPTKTRWEDLCASETTSASVFMRLWLLASSMELI